MTRKRIIGGARPWKNGRPNDAPSLSRNSSFARSYLIVLLPEKIVYASRVNAAQSQSQSQ